jgi:hypothetical protein
MMKGIRSSGMLLGVGWWFAIDVSGSDITTQAVQEKSREDNQI